MEKKTDIEKINSYEHLVEKLKKWEVSPQETWNLIQKIKFKGSPKTIWKMSKFHMYIRLEWLIQLIAKNITIQLKFLWRVNLWVKHI